MAGLSGKHTVVDIVAAAEQLSPSVPPEPEHVPAPQPGTCPFSHENAAGAQFCGTCGVRMDARVGRPDMDAARPRPAAQLDAGERAAREAEHAQALVSAVQFERAAEVIIPAEGDVVLIHFIEDGLTFAGRVWYRGQELAMGPGHPRWPEAVGWIMLDRTGQADRWGKQYFEHGPWPGQRSYVDPSARYERPELAPSEEDLRRADEAERMRNRGVPAAAM
jgi:hypothetical protein